MPDRKLPPEVTEPVHMLYRNMRHLRERDGLTLAQLANELDISEALLEQAETFCGVGYLQAEHIISLCSLFRVSATALMHEDLSQEQQQA